MKTSVIIILAVAVVVLVGAYFIFGQNGTGLPNNGTAPSATPGAPDGTGSNGTNPVIPTPPTAPSVNTGQGTVSSNSTVVVAGKVTPNGDQTSYWYEYGTTTSFGMQTNVSLIGSGFAAISAPDYITGLHANTVYYYRLNAKNNFGTVTGATYSFSTNSNPPPKGGVPIVHTTAGANIQRTIATLTGEINPNNSPTTFWFEYGAGTSLGSITQFQMLSSANALENVSASLSDLKPVTKYFFRLNAQNQYGTVIGPVQNFTTRGPATSTKP